MLDIYASAFMTATRTDTVQLREVPSKNGQKRRRWFAPRKTIEINPSKL
ncbi:hypothetical protein Z946_1247 [Sulfitobacter noctilucicola]|uniref:Uncharacterized protein n=1 Tax=Sulfitobacter noctilucicola TaxID=1342301 RepID=A0A7W6Q306_9RHOB|nr:hypothetical protein Z946_1247 [Sulfitobacter noctilucicola]MBB4173078.1 hypothetical protein [Sulfitobacter noctilucicola]